MLEGIWNIVEMRGPSIVSLLCISFLAYMCILQQRQIRMLNSNLDVAKEDIYTRFRKILEHTSEEMSDIKAEVGKQTEAIKGVCKTLDNVQRDIRQMRELR